MKIATWNVNSLRMRWSRVEAWLGRWQPDVLCLQETKVDDAQFPAAGFEALGYHVSYWGEPKYNGVAIATRGAPAEVSKGLGGMPSPQEQTRCIVAKVGEVQVLSVYVPNGQSVGSDKYQYKLRWLGELAAYVEQLQARGPVVVCGDYNVAPADLDVYDPAALAGDILCSDAERAALNQLLAVGLFDAYRALHPTERAFTWWDYRGVSFFKDRGLRIDHCLLSHALRPRLQSALIDRDERKGQGVSDHAPLVIELAA